MKRAMFTFYIDPDLRKGLRAVRDRDGITESEQIRRAVEAWLKRKRALKRTKGGRSKR